MRMNDTIEIIGEGSVIQHGKENDRIYLMSLKGDASVTIDKIKELAKSNGYSKIFLQNTKEYCSCIFR